MATRAKAPRYGWMAILGLLLLFSSVWPTASAALAQENKTYTSRKYGFTFEYPAAFELKVAVELFFDFKKGGETLFSLRVDDRFIEMLYQMLRPGLVVYRAGENPYRELAQETRQNKELFRRYARSEVKNWCSADGPDGSVYCRDIKGEKSFTSRSGLDCLEFYPLMTREDFTNNTKKQKVVGPVLALYLPQKELPVVLMISPLQGRLASPAMVQEMQGIVDSLRVTP